MNNILTQVVTLLLVHALNVSAQDTHGQPSPAVVSGHPDESLVNTITLTEQAVTRLGIETVEIRSDSIVNTRFFGGTIMEPSGNNIRIVSPYDSVVLPRDSGTLPESGSLLLQGQAILKLSILPLAQQMQGAGEVLEARKTELEIARGRVERAEQLLADGAGSLRDLENARLALADGEAAYKAAEIGGALAISGSTNNAGNLSTITIAAPKDVLIKDIFVSGGQLVSAGDPLVNLTNTDVSWVRVPIFTGYQNQFSRDAGAQIQNLGSSELPPVVARHITGPLTAESSSSTIDLYFELDNSGRRFRPGERVSVLLTETDSSQKLVVPESAIFKDIHGGSWVYVMHDTGLFVRERVELSQVIGNTAILTQGPPVGTPVVTTGVAELAGTEFGVAH